MNSVSSSTEGEPEPLRTPKPPDEGLQKNNHAPRSFGSFLSPGSFKPRSSALRGSILSPGLASSASPLKNSSFSLNPPKLSSPFLKTDKALETGEEAKTSEKSQEEPGSTSSDSTSSKSTVSFMPLKLDSAAPLPRVSSLAPPPLPAASSSGFVFGQNVRERVENAPDADKESTSSQSCEPEVQTNGIATSEMLFTSGVKKDSSEPVAAPTKTLHEAAKEYEETRAVKRKFEEVPVLTGEEEETNIVQMNCKLYAFDKPSSTWMERGRCSLRLNDLPGKHLSRLIVRTAGNFRLTVNTTIWADMAIDRPGNNSLTFTAIDGSQDSCVFLVKASQKEIDQLYRALDRRISQLTQDSDSSKSQLPSSASRQAKVLESSESPSDCEWKPSSQDEVLIVPEKVTSTSGTNSTSPVSFMPLKTDSSPPPLSTPLTPLPSSQSTTSSSFVFGENLHEKVEAPQSDKVQETPTAQTNGTTSEMLFTEAVKKDSSDSLLESSKGKSLHEAAKEYEEAHAVKRKFDEVPVVTGEEEETNIVQLNCKLFAFDKNTWVERGRGNLRLNDHPDKNQSRVIFRTSGSHRVALNTKVWAEMVITRSSNKGLTITALDNQVVKVFLIMGSPKDIDQLQKALEWRVSQLSESASSPKKSKLDSAS